ncbi:MAG TPA: translesion error-prone DNA polymerase V autoproteolytic subunit [Bacillota bacterium]|nr:translesion error-prone DNA polymerase V autoproteolytic subunit [Bacillota bacterium]
MTVEFFSPEKSSELELKYTGAQISAGFPSPAEDYLEPMLDLNKTLIKNPSSTFYGRVKGLSMKDAGVDDGDLLVIDKALNYRHDALCVCFINGEFTLKKVKREKDKIWLQPANPEYQPIEVTEEADFMIWGIVTYIIKRVY